MSKLYIKYLALGAFGIVSLITSCGRPDLKQPDNNNLLSYKEEISPELNNLINLIKAGKIQEAENIIKDKKVDLNTPKHAPILFAALYEQAPIVDALLKAGANPNARSAFDATPLHYAAFFGNLPIATSLINAGADVNAVDNYKNTPLHYSDARNHPQLSNLLIQKGASRNSEDEIPGLGSKVQKFKPVLEASPQPEFFWVIFNTDDADLAQALLDRRKNININSFGEGAPKPISLTYMFNRKNLSNLLKQKGADFSGINLWLISQPYTDKESFKDLLDHVNPDLSQANPEGFTLLQDAVYEGNKGTSEVLIEKGADTSQIYKSGKNIVDEAIEHAINMPSKYKRFEILDMLFDKNLKPTATNNLDNLLVAIAKYVGKADKDGKSHPPTPMLKKLVNKIIELGGNKDNAGISADPIYKQAIDSILAL